jgi:regulator-associated protein of mTOR
LGPQAVHLALLVGIYPYILKLLHSPSGDIKEVLVCIWSSIIGFDLSCRVDLVKEKAQQFFINYLSVTRPTTATLTPTTPTNMSNVHVNYRCLAAFVLAEICNGYQEGRATCLQQVCSVLALLVRQLGRL